MTSQPFVALVSAVALSTLGPQPARAQAPAGEGAPAENVITIEQILVKVNGDILTQTDLEDRQVAEIRQRGLQPTSNAQLIQYLNDVTPSVLVAAVDEMLLVQRGRELGYQMGDEQFDGILENLMLENGFANDDELAAALMEAEGMSVPELRRVMERQMLVSQVQQVEILNRVRMTDTEAREYYEEHLDEFSSPATATLREILVEVPDGAAGVNVFADEQALTVARTTVARLRDGEDFATVAAEVSDSPSRANGGLIGPLLVSEYSEGIQELIAPLEAGEVADPIRTDRGYQVVMLEARTEAQARPYDDVRDEIADNVFGGRRVEEYAAYLDTLRANAIVDWKNEDLKTAYDVERNRQQAVGGPIQQP